MPRIAEIREIDGQVWVRVDVDLPSPLTIWTDEERRAELLAERLSATERERERWKPAVTYFERYCLDEADEVENCVCGQQQHDDARAFAAAIRSQP